MIFMVVACSSDSEETTSDSDTNTGTDTVTETDNIDVDNIVTIEDIISINKESHEDSDDYTYDESSITEITLNGDSITIDGDGATAEVSIVTINSAGTYRISGTLTDGQVIVDSEDDEIVQLLFNGINVNCNYNAPIYIKQSEKTIIILEEDTNSYISDAEEYEEEEEDANAAIYSEDDLSISGTGSLTVTANYNDGITSKDGLVINSGYINVTSVDDGIRGKDYIYINNAVLTLDVEGDGLKSDEDEDENKGFITIEDVEATIVAGNDAIQAETNILIYYGQFDLTSGGGSSASLSDEDSAKGLKAGINMAIEDGIYEINTADDGVHSNNSILLLGGEFNIATGDDGIHSDEILQIDGGTIDITKSYEGIESSYIMINDGEIHIVSSDDGINGAGGSDSSGFGGSFGGSSSDYYIYINGGYIVVNSSGDGIDVNGTLEMASGTVIVNGPTTSGNGALDYDSSFKMTGGFIVAVGSSGMSQNASSSSSQYSVLVKLSSTQSANNMLNVQTSDGKNIFSFVPEKTYQSIMFS